MIGKASRAHIWLKTARKLVLVRSSSPVFTGANTCQFRGSRSSFDSYATSRLRCLDSSNPFYACQPRSLVTTLRAAELFEPTYLSSQEIKSYIDNATHFYIEGFFLTHGLESVLIIAKQAALSGKSVTLNLSAPFLVQSFKVQMEVILPYADIVIGNESEAAAWAAASGSDTVRIPDPLKLVPSRQGERSLILLPAGF
jgi:hypothetical protein